MLVRYVRGQIRDYHVPPKAPKTPFSIFVAECSLFLSCPSRVPFVICSTSTSLQNKSQADKTNAEPEAADFETVFEAEMAIDAGGTPASPVTVRNGGDGPTVQARPSKRTSAKRKRGDAAQADMLNKVEATLDQLIAKEDGEKK